MKFSSITYREASNIEMTSASFALSGQYQRKLGAWWASIPLTPCVVVNGVCCSVRCRIDMFIRVEDALRADCRFDQGACGKPMSPHASVCNPYRPVPTPSHGRQRRKHHEEQSRIPSTRSGLACRNRDAAKAALSGAPPSDPSKLSGSSAGSDPVPPSDQAARDMV